ncbi:protein IL-40 isoform X2 [Kogia breviceps]|uniref:protein IL-40 isoform X2 n=1 Tax=Kogia breviceps TaxID=27615 RepID=UPI0034D1EFBE
MAVLLFCLAALATSSFAKQEKEPVSQLQADFTLLDRGSGLRVEVFCQASSGSPPITYRLVRRNGHIHMQQTQSPGQPANFSFPLSQTSDWFRCQAENDISVQHTTFTLVPPGERAPWSPEGQPALLSRRAAPGTHLRAGWLPHLHHSHLLLETELDQADQMLKPTTRWKKLTT